MDVRIPTQIRGIMYYCKDLKDYLYNSGFHSHRIQLKNWFMKEQMG